MTDDGTWFALGAAGALALAGRALSSQGSRAAKEMGYHCARHPIVGPFIGTLRPQEMESFALVLSALPYELAQAIENQAWDQGVDPRLEADDLDALSEDDRDAWGEALVAAFTQQGIRAIFVSATPQATYGSWCYAVSKPPDLIGILPDPDAPSASMVLYRGTPPMLHLTGGATNE